MLIYLDIGTDVGTSRCRRSVDIKSVLVIVHPSTHLFNIRPD